MLDIAIDTATTIAALLAVGAFAAYNVAARWWQTRSGTAVFVLYTALMVLGGHFVIEAYTGVQAAWRELVVVIILCAALAWNLATVLWKQHYYRSSDDGEMDR